ALLGHAIGGWYGAQEVGFAGDRWASLGGYDVRVVEASTVLGEGGVVRSQRARVEVRDPRTGGTFRREIGPNDPARWDGGTEMLLLLQVQEGIGQAVLTIDGRADTLGPGQSRMLEGGGRLTVQRIFGPPEFRVPVARVTIDSGPRAGTFLLGLGLPPEIPGIALTGSAGGATMAILTYRHAPGTNWLLVAALVFACGTALTGLRWLRRWTIMRAARAG
ncbi:MAG: hypothetical protein QUU85_07615, partial [Candidatus Eisenbacteria bacterium]|nr:hypothetical protein [Candidatus Eisenbacteria bacterium]